MRSIVIAAAVLALAATGAQAKSWSRACTSAPASQYLSGSELWAKAEAQGYRVKGVEIERGCADVDAFDKNGREVDLYLDPTDGKIVGLEYDD